MGLRFDYPNLSKTLLPRFTWQPLIQHQKLVPIVCCLLQVERCPVKTPTETSKCMHHICDKVPVWCLNMVSDFLRQFQSIRQWISSFSSLPSVMTHLVRLANQFVRQFIYFGTGFEFLQQTLISSQRCLNVMSNVLSSESVSRILCRSRKRRRNDADDCRTMSANSIWVIHSDNCIHTRLQW